MDCDLIRCLGDNLLGMARTLEEHNHYLKLAISKAKDFNEIKEINIYLDDSLKKYQKIFERILVIRCS